MPAPLARHGRNSPCMRFIQLSELRQHTRQPEPLILACRPDACKFFPIFPKIAPETNKKPRVKLTKPANPPILSSKPFGPAPHKEPDHGRRIPAGPRHAHTLAGLQSRRHHRPRLLVSTDRKGTKFQTHISCRPDHRRPLLGLIGLWSRTRCLAWY